MRNENPIDHIVWRKASELSANSYNPNIVFTPELKLLERSILTLGWVQPILITPDGMIIDGFHRWQLSQESRELTKRYKGLVPCSIIDVDVPSAMIITVRMNRAKGSPASVRMSELVKSVVREYDYDPDQVALEIGATRAEVGLLLQDNVFKALNLEGYRYGKSWKPIEDHVHPQREQKKRVTP